MKLLKVCLQPFSSTSLIHFLEWNRKDLVRTEKIKRNMTKEAINKMRLERNEILSLIEQMKSCPNGTKLKTEQDKRYAEQNETPMDHFPKNMSFAHACHRVLWKK